MSPLPLAAFNYTLSNGGPSFASNASSTISTIVFGVLAVAASVIGIWQAYKAWSIWQGHHHADAVMRNARHTTVESHGTQTADPAYHVSDSIALVDMAMPHASHAVRLDTSGEPGSNRGNHSQPLASTIESRAPPIAHSAAHLSPPEDPVHIPGQVQGDTQDPVSSTMSGHPIVDHTAH